MERALQTDWEAGVQAADGRRGCLQVSEEDDERFTVHIPAGTQPGAQRSSKFTHRAAKQRRGSSLQLLGLSCGLSTGLRLSVSKASDSRPTFLHC